MTGKEHTMRKRPVKRKPPKTRTFSHWLMTAVAVTYFIGLALSCYVVIHILVMWPEYAVQAFLGLLSYIGAPVAVAIGFYNWKAKNENLAKIKNANSSENNTEGDGFIEDQLEI